MGVISCYLDNIISIHALLAESDLNCSRKGFAILYFYPRSPCGERRERRHCAPHHCQISIHALLAESDSCTAHNRQNQKISIHALLAESDFHQSLNLPSRPIISIHALLAESDRLWIMLYSCPGNFYPRSPCGERLDSSRAANCQHHFYPRSPCGERPGQNLVNSVRRIISIHALLAESDKENR